MELELRLRTGQPAAAEAVSAFIVRLEGEFDLTERERLTDAFSVANTAALVIVDFEKTDFIDSSIVQCLVSLHTATQKRGAELVFVGINNQVGHLFKVTELEKFFTIRNSAAEVADIDRGDVRRLTIEARPLG